MATKKDLIEAQGFSRRRLLTAFTSGAPGGKELEPAQPLRAVAAAVALTAMVVLAGVFYGLIRPGLPDGWQNDRLILVKDTGARYVSANSVLHPVINTASARLLIPAKDFSVISTDQSTIADLKVGATIGILGAPDNLPPAASLIRDGWTACVAPGAKTAVSFTTTSLAKPTTQGAVVRDGEKLWVIDGERRYAVDPDASDSVLRAAGLDGATVSEVDDRWLNLFQPGEPLTPLLISNAGDSVRGSTIRVGEAVHPQGNQQDDRFVMTDDGTLARLSPFAYRLYLLGTGSRYDKVADVSPSEISNVPNAKSPAGGIDWPTEQLEPVAADKGTCAVLTHDKATPHTVLGVSAAPPTAGGVSVTTGSGALVRAGGTGDQASSLVYLIDASGIAYAIPGGSGETISRLGYKKTDVTRATTSWIRFLAAGPQLTQKAAGSAPRDTQGAG